MVQSCQFFLRNYNTDEFNHMIEQILDEDEELTALENKEIFEYIQKFYMTSPGKTLALVILWAFHTESFDPIVEVIEDYESCNVDQKPDDDNNQIMYETCKFLQSRGVEPKHVKEFLEIAVTYGISGSMATIPMQTHVDKDLDVNPMIYCELASMLYFGNNYLSMDREKAVQLFQSAADKGYIPAMWILGHLSNHSSHDVDIKSAFTSKNYYMESYKNAFPLSMNNLGIIYHRAMIYYLTSVCQIDIDSDCFRFEGTEA